MQKTFITTVKHHNSKLRNDKNDTLKTAKW